jgi:hypothetical protein
VKLPARSLRLAILRLFPEPTSPWRSAAAVAETLERELKATRRTLAAMRDGGLMEERRGLWRSRPDGRAVLAASGRARAPRRDFRQRLWSALRRLKKATIKELVTLAAAQERDARRNAQRYLRGLAAAGYVRALPRPGRGRANAWVLVRDSGPRAPSYSPGAATITDPNNGEVHHV